ncbi:hypothetical protein BD309DRAFT_871177 [Dichomitus squalens]|uniref:Uncharacterized protein n=2 Tax=Dichomitus squalens TaxID=114155 RepID=A0A4Q9MGI8_9APHY|nr:uncharacterized protein DICSQDRAFT_136040 [Dichomitus squalens LYAD-421 SS1]EJF61913.1 hypothetical protein DICSQDRAFT_136040 [Dichomitus squalens LYAD-421 SS1]TBU25242.1 hypothetical protein BD311DRAFT_764885 [Dichomitus squalens]TBU39999.1 hypothetical protein BD309DRAFT_871177 [Dichomitus squalens]TBU51820.1 hypothetical protein BD310DRAFT_833526 [Dichomitus squalens]
MSRRSSSSTLPEHNDVMLTPDILIGALHDLSTRLRQYFPSTVRLVVHGGAIMVLHPMLACRGGTRDVDFIKRSFEAEWIALGVTDAGARLATCIKATARKFHLGADWMNSAADVALPMAFDAYGKTYDPIYTDAVSPANMSISTLFTSPGLVIIGVSWAWSIALKLVRYDKHDPQDIASILRLGRNQRNVKWTRSLLESWLVQECGAMGYAAYAPWQMEALRKKMRNAIELAYHPPPAVPQLGPVRVY